MNLLFPNDEELRKKNDDHRPNASTRPQKMFNWRRARRGRVFVGIVAVAILYVFFKNIPTDVPPVSQRKDLRFERPIIDFHGTGTKGRHGPPPGHSKAKDETSEQTYEGTIKFQNLANSLDAIHAVRQNSNVLFVASSLKSASSLIPLACQMASSQRNKVHFALVGRNDIAIDKIKELNGVEDKQCEVSWHDGRPDYAVYSTDWRMEVSIKAAITYICSDIMPQIVLVDDFRREDDVFKKGFMAQIKKYQLPFLELPSTASESMQWLARLDAAALKVWKTIQIDVLIQAPRESSGSLIRLLKSIEDADYTGSTFPRIIVDLPEDIDKPILNFVESFRWPPKPHSSDLDDKLILHHRINGERLDHDQAAQRSLELVFPKNPHMSHVLVLSPQAELSPSYFQYLKYTLLEYRYSSLFSPRLMGISLDLPSKQLDGVTKLDLPNLGKGHHPFFLSQQPNSNAALYLGAFWREVHSLISHRLSTPPAKTKIHEKQVSDHYPSWLEYCLELMRARGSFLLYPGFAINPESAMAVIHHELYQLPEGTAPNIKDKDPTAEDLPPRPDSEKAKDLTAEIPSPFTDPEPSLLSPSTPLLDLIGLTSSSASSSTASTPNAATLPPFSHLPALDASGKPLNLETIDEITLAYAHDFALDQGGCRNEKEVSEKRGKMEFAKAGDLFCGKGGRGVEDA